MVMRTNYKRHQRIKTVKLKPPMSRGKRPRLPRRSRIIPQEKVVGKTEPTKTELAAVSAETAPDRGMPLADNLQLYLREIGQVNLLTLDEEIALAKKVRKGDRKAREHMIKA